MYFDSEAIFQILQLLVAVFLGGIIGLEREFKRKQAGVKTYSLICLASCLFALIGREIFEYLTYKGGIPFDPLRIIQAVAVGIGFVGAGVIFQRESGIEGITTAAGLLVTAGIGVAVAFQFFLLAFITTLLTLLILEGFRLIEKRFFYD